MAYRDEREALRARLKNLENQRDGLRTQKLELEAATARLDNIDAELVDVQERLESGRPLPMLNDLKVASPCPAEWDDMVGDDQVRFCGGCAKNVYNVVELTLSEVEEVVQRVEGELCVRLYRRKDGTVITADCPVGRRIKRRRRIVAGVVMAATASLGVQLYGSLHELKGETLAQQGGNAEADTQTDVPYVFERKEVLRRTVPRPRPKNVRKKRDPNDGPVVMGRWPGRELVPPPRR